MKTSNRQKIVRHAVSAALFAAVIASPTRAQETDSAGESMQGVETITVTARKRDESLQDVPIAVTVLSADDIAARGVGNYMSLQDFAPGFRLQNQTVGRNDRGLPTFIMRGMVPGTTLPDRQAASIFIDGVPVAGGAIAGLSDVSRIEVVPGPQSAYFGRSTFAGAVNFVTQPPSFDFGTKAAVSFASHDRQEYTASIEGGVIPELLALRLSGRHFRTDGPYDNFGYSGKLGAQETSSVTGSFNLKPSQQLSVRGSFTYWEDDDGPPATGQLIAADYNCAAGAAGSTLNYICGEIKTVPANRMTQNVEVPSFVVDTLTSGPTVHGKGFSNHFGLQRKAYQAMLLADYELGDHTLSMNASKSSNKFRIITDTTFRDNRGTVNPSYTEGSNLVPYLSRTVLTEFPTETESAEIRLTSPGEGRLRYLLGGSYFDQTLIGLTSIFGNTGYQLVQPASYFTVDTYGIFGAVEYDFTSKVTLSVEGRYQWDKIGTNTPTRENASAEETFRSFSPRIILNYNSTVLTKSWHYPHIFIYCKR